MLDLGSANSIRCLRFTFCFVFVFFFFFFVSFFRPLRIFTLDFKKRFQHAYFRMYSNNIFFVNGIMEFFGLINNYCILK